MFSEQNPQEDPQDQAQPADSSPEGAEQAASSAEQAKAAEEQPEQSTADAQQEPPLPEINFATFVVSMNASALLHLGAIEDPNTGQTNKDLAMAKQTIDILSMLEEKTKGNLTGEEENLLKNILYDLRIIYVKESG